MTTVSAGADAQPVSAGSDRLPDMEFAEFFRAEHKKLNRASNSTTSNRQSAGLVRYRVRQTNCSVHLVRTARRLARPGSSQQRTSVRWSSTSQPCWTRIASLGTMSVARTHDPYLHRYTMPGQRAARGEQITWDIRVPWSPFTS